MTLGDDWSIESEATTYHGRLPDLRLPRMLSSLPLDDGPGAATGLPGDYADGYADGTCTGRSGPTFRADDTERPLA